MIRAECFVRPADGWQQPTGSEVAELLDEAKLTGGAAARLLGLSVSGDRTVRRWISGDSAIPFAAWAILAENARGERIW